MKTSDKILVYSGDIDFQYIESQSVESGLEYVYAEDNKAFSDLCLKNKYELIIYNASGTGSIDTIILRSLTGSRNLYTPVLIICSRDDTDIMSQALRHQFDLIIFPFSHDEIIIRIKSAIRRKQTELTIHNNLLDFRLLFENFPVGVLQTDEHGNFIRYNKELMNILGMQDIDFSGVSFFQLSHPDDYLIERQNLDRMLRKESEKASFELRLVNNDGKTIVTRISTRIIWIDEDTFGSFIFSVEEIS